MTDINLNVTKMNPPGANMRGFTYAIPIGAMALISYDGVEVQILGGMVQKILTPRHQVWANLIARAALRGPSSAMRLDEARDEFSTHGVVIQACVTPHHITPLWAIPAQRWNKGADKEDLGLRLAQMRFMVQGAGLDNPKLHNPPAVRLPMLMPVNPYCAGAGPVDGCRDLQAVILQCRFVLQEMRDRWALVVPHDEPWRRKAESHYLVDAAEQSELYALMQQDEEI